MHPRLSHERSAFEHIAIWNLVPAPGFFLPVHAIIAFEVMGVDNAYSLRGLGFVAHWPFDPGLEENDSNVYVKKVSDRRCGYRSSFKRYLPERQHRSCQRREGHAMGRSRRTRVPAPRAAARSS